MFCVAAHYKVKCSPETMLVEMVRPDNSTNIYLEHLKGYPDTACHPEIEHNKATFRLSLTDVFQCGVTRVHNFRTGRSTYYHRVIVEEPDKSKEVILVKCISTSQHRERRDVLPAGFQESDLRDVELHTVNGTAPEPILGVGVRQGGQLVTGELNVNPGTPLQMEIFLDKGSSSVYGLLVSYMKVTDTKVQEETIIFNGCSVDPYLFENFNTVDGDFLSAKFRAFKFPESTYVECSNGQVGYGRRRREVPSIPADPNKVFEVTMSTFIKVDYKDDAMLEKAKLGGSVIQSLSEDVNTANSQEQPNAKDQHLKLETEEVREELHFTVIEENSSATNLSFGSLIAALVILCIFAQ
ncbi:hypothetical protein C0J52_27172 [Blattella germanica]|nr:hypothetical protein C0J52_27172 [Blattella germanica]